MLSSYHAAVCFFISVEIKILLGPPQTIMFVVSLSIFRYILTIRSGRQMRANLTVVLMCLLSNETFISRMELLTLAGSEVRVRAGC